jgi:hypothetical protein
MKNVFLLIVVPVLLVTFGFGQTAAPSSNTDQASVKGCLGGSDGNYTVAEEGTTQTFKITSSAVDLKPHVGHDVEVIGQKTNVATGSGSSDNSVVVTGLNMISEHCASAIASAPAATTSTPAAADTTPATTASTPAAIDTTSTATTSAPAAVDTTPTATTSAPAAVDTTPTATTRAPAMADRTSTETASAPMTTSARAPESTEHLPDTATPLPLLGLLSLGLLATGLLTRRSRKNQQ